MNARDIIKLAAQLYVYDALKKKITILTNIQKGKDINVDIFLPKVLEKEIKINKIDTRIQLTAMAAILKPSEMSDTDFVLKINEKMSELWSEEALIR